jgi:sodium/potassium-transporting ATPase subunit alpha
MTESKKGDLELVKKEKDIQIHIDRDRTLTFHEARVLGQELKKELGIKSPKAEEKIKVIDIDDHYLEFEKLEGRYGTGVDLQMPWNSKGLEDSKAAELLKKNGPNMLTPPKKTHPLIIFLSEFKHPLTALLLLCGVLSLILYSVDSNHDLVNLYLGAVLIGVTILNALVDFVQLQKSAAILDSFNVLVPQNAICVRSGRQQKVPAQELVVGDLIYVKEGDKVPADIRLVYVVNFKVDNSSLTGESDPQLRKIEALTGNVRVVEAENLAFGGTIVFSGEAYGIVIRCGDHTVLGQIAGLTTEKKRASPLNQEIERTVRFISIIASVMAIIFFIAGMSIKPNFSLNFVFLIGIFVANIPQGLPATVTLLLSFAVKRMSQKNVLVKDLQGVDTLGSITLLASDKTGTMTQNKMTVVHVWINRKHYDNINLPSQNIQQSGDKVFDLSVSGGKDIVQTCYICSKAKFDASEENMKLPISNRKVFGDATESGLLKFAAEYFEQEVVKGIESIKKFEVPFNSANKWALTVISAPHETGSLKVFLKGAPERVYKRCSTIYENGVIRELNEDDFKLFEEAYEDMASHGQRVLAFAFKNLKGEEFPDSFEFKLDPPNYPAENLTFLGLIGLMDPPKERVADAVKACRDAHIQVMMITGDHPFTAEAIARKIGLITGDTIEQAAEKLGKPIQQVREDEYQAVVIHGDKIDTMTNQEWEVVLRKKEIAFARTSPIHKLEIVARCQALGHVVAVTGDGVNDSPALKKADLGISMGISGSDISKDVAGMILLDDNFATIVDGIKEGRLIFANLKKCVGYVLTHIAPEIWPFLFYIVAGLPLALNSIQILMIDLGTELPPSLSLSWEPCEGDIMTKPPRKQVIPRTGLLVVSPEEAYNLAAVPSFIIETVELEPPKPKKWWQFWVTNVDPKAKLQSSNESSSAVRLVDKELLIWSYLIGGSIESLAGFAGFFWVFYRYGIGFSSLWGLARDGEVYSTSEPLDAVVSGNAYTGKQLKDYLAEAQTAYFMSIVFVQFFVLIVKKVDSGYPWGQFMLVNKRTYYSFILSLGFALFCAYVPFMNIILLTDYLHIEGYIPAFIGGVLVIAVEFLRKYILKNRKETVKAVDTAELSRDHEPSIEQSVTLQRSLSINKSMKRKDQDTKKEHAAISIKE